MINTLTEIPQILCTICGDINAARHYGSVCCSGCKNFFRRCVINKQVLKCSYGNQCTVTPEFRRCRTCRYEKCMQVGMDPKLVRNKCISHLPLPDTDQKMQKYIKSEGELVICSSQKFYTKFSIPLGKLNIIPEFSRNDHPEDVLKYFILAEQLCDNYYDSYGNHMELSDNDYHHTDDLPLKKVLLEPCLMSDRTKIQWKSDRVFKIEKLKRHACRIMCYYLDWIYHVPELSMLNDSDKEILVIDRLNPCLSITTIHRSILHNIPGIALTGGTYLPYSTTKNQKSTPVETFESLLKWEYEHYYSMLKRINPTFEEYTMLRLLVLFVPPACMSIKGKEIIREANNFYRNVMIKHIQSACNDNPLETMNRFGELMTICPIVETFNHMCNQTLSVMVMFEYPSLLNNLLYDIYRQKCINGLL